MRIHTRYENLIEWIRLLRWDKPSGRLILLIPAGWSLWLTPNSPPPINIVFLIIFGGISVSGAGCIANDLWDRRFDKKVTRTENRPLAKGSINIKTGYFLLFFMLSISLIVVYLLPIESRDLCIRLSIISIFPILIYPSTKRWFKFPQIILAICWGFSVLIPWAATESNLAGGIPLLSCWLGTCLWTFGFDTVYAMSDKEDDKRIGLNSSALTLNEKANYIVSICYALTSVCLGISAYYAGVKWIF